MGDAYRERLSALLTKKADRAERKLKKQEAARAAAVESGTAPATDITDQSFVIDDDDDDLPDCYSVSSPLSGAENSGDPQHEGALDLSPKSSHSQGARPATNKARGQSGTIPLSSLQNENSGRLHEGALDLSPKSSHFQGARPATNKAWGQSGTIPPLDTTTRRPKAVRTALTFN